MRRLARLEWFELGGIRVYVARGVRARLLGLALMRALPDDVGLLIPRCRSVHTVGMRFALDLVFVDERGRRVKDVASVGPGRVVACRGAAAVVELPAARDGRMPDMANEQNRLANALNPRVPIYRDAYTEYFVFVLSALGASVIVPVILYIAMAFSDLWGLLVFAAACVVFELVLIFGLARPQMKPKERVGWAFLWGFTAAALGLAFYELVAKPTL
jgi:uncharacterized membrane protein (UPF0127 family)